MFNRLYFPLIALFWIVMDVLLWRTEFGGGKKSGSAVSTGVVWQRILTAPDDSSMEISWNGRRIGYCRWVANADEETSARKLSGDEYEPGGMIGHLRDYAISLDGSLIFGEPHFRTRFKLRAQFAANHDWQELSIHVVAPPGIWDVRAAAADGKVTLNYESDDEKWERAFTFEELRHPRQLLEEFSGPLPLVLLGPAASLEQQNNLSVGLEWEAHNDWLPIGHADVRVYRLRAHLLDRYEAVVLVSRVGEILRVELPGGLLFVSETLKTF